MREFIYRLIARKKHLLKSFLILSLLTFTSMAVTFLPQRVNPHLLRAYLENFCIGSISGQNTSSSAPEYDFLFGGFLSNTPSYIDNTTITVEKVSQRVYGLCQLNEAILFILFSLPILNISNSNSILMGIPSDWYQSINQHCQYSTTSGAILLSPFQNDTLGKYYVSLARNETEIIVTNKISKNNFSAEFANLNNFLTFHFTPLRIFFLPIMELIEQYSHFIEVSQTEPFSYSIYGYINFNQYQKDILYWSKDSIKKAKQFEYHFQKELKELGFKGEFFMSSYVDLYDESMFANIAYAFISAIQLLVWTISIVLCVLTIKKLQTTNASHELRILFAGKNWRQRLSHHFLESSILTITSSAVALVFLYPFLQLQLVFQMAFVFDANFLLPFCLVFIILFCTIFIVFLDFEFYLHRMINSHSKKIDYQLFERIPKLLKWSIPFVILLIVWLFNSDYLYLIVYLSFGVLTFVLGFLVVFLERAFLSLGMRFYYKKKMAGDRPLSPKYLLLKLWNKRLKSKLFVYTFVLLSISSTFLFMNYTADAKQSEYLWWDGAEIVLSVPSEGDLASLDNTLSNVPEIIDFTKDVHFNHYSKGDEDFSYTFNGTAITEVDSSFIGSYVDEIIAINFSDYFQFYKEWNKRDWLFAGKLNDFDEETIFISQAVHSLGVNINDRITFYNESFSFTVKGIINAWPSITDQRREITSSDQIFILDLNFLQGFLEVNAINYTLSYRVHTTEEDIQSVVDSLSVEMSAIPITTINYLNMDVFIGIRKIFLAPMLILAQLLLLLLGGLFLFDNFEQAVVSSKVKQLGILALIKNHRHSFRWYLLVEGLMLYFGVILLFILMFGMSFGFLHGFQVVYNMKAVVISRHTIENSIFLNVYYLVLLLFQSVIEYRKLKFLNLSLLYRHSE